MIRACGHGNNVDTCAVCGDVEQIDNMIWVEAGDDVPDAEPGDLVCTECAGCDLDTTG